MAPNENIDLRKNKEQIIDYLNSRKSVFICSSSLEERSAGVSKILFPDYKPRLVVMLEYDSERIEGNNQTIELKKLLSPDVGISEIKITDEQILPAIDKVCSLIEKSYDPGNDPIVVFDLSSVPKWHILLFLRSFEGLSLNNEVICMYTMPEDYPKFLKEPQSNGVSKIINPPTYYGDFDFSKESILAIILGYEGDRSLALYENIDPSECFLFVPDPPYRKEWKGRTERFNEAIINMVGKTNVKKLDSINPLRIKDELNGFFSSFSFINKNLIIAPLGTKPQIVGLYLHLKGQPQDKVVCYVAPRVRNELEISTGIGDSWVLRTKSKFGWEQNDQ